MNVLRLRKDVHYTVHPHRVLSGRGLKFLLPSVSLWLNQYGVIYTLDMVDGSYSIFIEDNKKAAQFKLVWL